MKYTRLTKIIKDCNGNDVVVCSFYGTEKCPIHIDCGKCEMTAAIFAQLNAFENIYLEGLDENSERNKNSREGY